jgi:hypothetical protein
LLKYCLRAKAKASKKRLNFCEVRVAFLVRQKASPPALIGAFFLRKSQVKPGCFLFAALFGLAH